MTSNDLSDVTSHSFLVYSSFVGAVRLSTRSSHSVSACFVGCLPPRWLAVIRGRLGIFLGSLSSREGFPHCELPTYGHIGTRFVVSVRSCSEGYSYVLRTCNLCCGKSLLRSRYQGRDLLLRPHHHTRSCSGFHVLCSRRLRLGRTLDTHLVRILFS